MPKLKRRKDAKRSSVMVKGKEKFRTRKDAAEALAAMEAYVPDKVQLETVRLLAANNTPKKDILALLDISEGAFDASPLGKAFKFGKLEKSIKVTQTLYDMAIGHEGVWDNKKKKWTIRPRGPDLGAAIWWDKTRTGMSESSNVNVRGRGMGGNTINNVQQNVILYIPPNGRESGARGDPTFVLREQQRVIEQQAKTAER